jgi:hypothetical protein
MMVLAIWAIGLLACFTALVIIKKLEEWNQL